MNTTSTIAQLVKTYKRNRLAEIMLFTLSMSTVVIVVLKYILTASIGVIISLSSVISLVTFALQYYYLQLHQLYPIRIVNYVNTHYPELKFSTHLLLRDTTTLSRLELLQREQTAQLLENLKPTIKLPNGILRAGITFITSIILSWGISQIEIANTNALNQDTPEILQKLGEVPRHPSVIRQLTLTITPPAYTKQSTTKSSDPNIDAIEGSKITWTMSLDSSIHRVYIALAGGDTLKAMQRDSLFIVSTKLTTSGFYQIGWNNEISDYYKIDISTDQEPKINLKNQNQFTEFEFTSQKEFIVATDLEDDFGLSEAFIIATVSKGSGESVKFREEKLIFTKPETIEGKKITATRVINLDKFGMEPGDELYYYIVARDNKTPFANHSRTETYFVSIRDTAAFDISFDGGLGVDLMPEYFRSQRQIIIDTEKLIREKKVITKQEFNSRSNELGYDQKVLRLRYGQFMGEEFESGITQESVAQEDHDHDHEEEDVVKKFGHVHDTENEHNHVEHKKEELHNHQHEPKKPDEPQNMLDEFVHMHDDAEVATFFIQSLKAKLKAALTVMWDAELYLRLYEPEKSLPYQYTALRLLKEISNDSRIYVHRTGFDPPPIKEDKRLSGDLTDVHNELHRWVTSETTSYPAIRKAIPVIEVASQTKTLSPAQKEILQAAGSELAQLAIANPGNYLSSLSALRALLDNNVTSQNTFLENIRVVQQACWSAIPQEKTRPGNRKQTTSLNDLLLNELTSPTNR